VKRSIQSKGCGLRAVIASAYDRHGTRKRIKIKMSFDKVLLAATLYNINTNNFLIYIYIYIFYNVNFR